MSQVNKFKQDQNPDYLYFDLQQTNVQNTTEFIQQPLKFIETRDTPIVANSGEYHLSVTRFQLDTYNLPVLVVEPDLTQTENLFDPNQTIYKVALIPKASYLINDIGGITTAETSNFTESATPIRYNYGLRSKYLSDNERIWYLTSNELNVGGEQGTMKIWNSTTNTIITLTQNVGSTTLSADVSLDGSTAISGYTATLGGRGIVIWKPNTSLNQAITFQVPAYTSSLHTTAISGDGSRIIACIPSVYRFYLYNYDAGTSSINPLGGPYISASSVTTFGITGISANLDGKSIAFSSSTSLSNAGAVAIFQEQSAVGTNTYIYAEQYFYGTLANDRLGTIVAMSKDGFYVAGATSNTTTNTRYVNIYKKTGTATTYTWSLFFTITPITTDSMSLTDNGNRIFIQNGSNIFRYSQNALGTAYVLDVTIINNPTLGALSSIASNNTGNKFATFNFGANMSASNGTRRTFTITTTSVGSVVQLNSAVKDKPIIQNVIWSPDYKEAQVPRKNILDGRNTALYQYYYCNAYENFIARVNDAIKLAYITMIGELWYNWVQIINIAPLTNQFLDIVLKHYAPPPFLEWNEAELKAEIYATLLFQNTNYTTNYLVPSITWATSGADTIGTIQNRPPFEFQIAMNAPLYSLFNSLPASKKVLVDSSSYRENYYILNFFTSGRDLVNPVPPLSALPYYDWASAYYTNSTTITIPSQYTRAYSRADFLLRQPQELSTIDTWTPINAIVFTTTSLPIVVNQFSATSSIGEKPPSTSSSNEFAFIITDIQSNDQGFRPNVLYSPSAQYRYIDLTGNQPIRNIDISVFWRTTTGALIPFVLASGAQASIKLLFEKKDKTNQKEANASTLATSVRDIV
jgi:hypothetical protein